MKPADCLNTTSTYDPSKVIPGNLNVIPQVIKQWNTTNESNQMHSYYLFVVNVINSQIAPICGLQLQQNNSKAVILEMWKLSEDERPNGSPNMYALPSWMRLEVGSVYKAGGVAMDGIPDFITINSTVCT
ncbi:unnamed protein product [Bursaphelenchus xylophilus]|uniref:(pine wood nematode) hypothetical protein n=1 Tax=Bursaphelenchus xylophilus TaxID=6326 RepID=A0A1I7SM40_BURXY|nr:unnamed protein product [Bursaphelenchus xylophilus]CAG9129988.1 unnamed protein product [Bursaphelenchus xylophilus]